MQPARVRPAPTDSVLVPSYPAHDFYDGRVGSGFGFLRQVSGWQSRENRLGRLENDGILRVWILVCRRDERLKGVQRRLAMNIDHLVVPVSAVLSGAPCNEPKKARNK